MLVSAAAAEIAGALTPSDVCGLFGVCPNAVAALGLPAMQVGHAVRFGAKGASAACPGRLLRPCKPCLQPCLQAYLVLPDWTQAGVSGCPLRTRCRAPLTAPSASWLWKPSSRASRWAALVSHSALTALTAW